jgi:hypothetical protein
VLVDLLLSYRAEEAWDEMVGLCERFPERLKQVRVVRQQWALALNRRHQAGDRERAVSMLNALLQERGVDPETLGILGRAHKDRYAEARAKGSIMAAAALDDAIKAYSRGFDADPRDYYPGINAITLLVERGDAAALTEVERLAPPVAFAADRRGGVEAQDYWVLATTLELACVRGDWALAARALPRVVAGADEAWKADSTAGNLDLLAQALARRGTAVAQLAEIIAHLRQRAAELRGGA